MNWIDYRTTRPLSYSRADIAAFPEVASITLSAGETALLFSRAIAIEENPYRIEEQEAFTRNAKKLAACFSENTRARIELVLQTGFGAVHVKGLPVDKNLPLTPVKGGSLSPEYKKTFVSEAMLLALGVLTGAEPFNFRQEGMGMSPLIDNIVPVPGLRTQKGAGGFDNNFPFHCESAWHRKRPDYLILLGIREAADAKTLIFSASMLEGTSWMEESRNMQGSFRLKAPDLYVQMEEAGIPMGTAAYSFEPPVHEGKNGIRLNVNFNGTDCTDIQTVEWLARFEEFVETKAVGAVIAEGSALLINNHRTCHTRTGYVPVFNGMDRWFLRGYFKSNLWSYGISDTGVKEEFDENDIQQLISLGWMNEDRILTPAFSKFVYEPAEIKKLDSQKSRLAEIACKHTPIPGSRIV